MPARKQSSLLAWTDKYIRFATTFVRPAGIEPATNCLKGNCSTAELWTGIIGTDYNTFILYSTDLLNVRTLSLRGGFT